MNASFAIGKEFYYQKNPSEIISGLIYYFRILPADWGDHLYTFHAMGSSTVETYTL